MLAPTSQTVLTSFQGYSGLLELVDGSTISLLTIKNGKGTQNFPQANHGFVEALWNASGWIILTALPNLLCTFPPGIKSHESYIPPVKSRLTSISSISKPLDIAGRPFFLIAYCIAVFPGSCDAPYSGSPNASNKALAAGSPNPPVERAWCAVLHVFLMTSERRLFAKTSRLTNSKSRDMHQ